MSTTSNTPADLYEYLKFITGQDNLSVAQANMLFKYAVDDYSHLAMVSDGVHKFDDLTHVNGSGQPTYPIATSTVSSANPKIQLDATFLMLDRVTVTVNGVEKPLTAIDRRDYKDRSLLEVFGDSGVPTHYDYDAHGIEVFPHPDGSYTATAYYSRAARYIDVTDSVTEIGIPRIHHQYLALHCARQLGFRTIDGNRTDVAAELAKWEGVPGVKGKIAVHYNSRDEDRAKRMKPKNLSGRVAFNRV
jgi:hypothetical protein